MKDDRYCRESPFSRLRQAWLRIVVIVPSERHVGCITAQFDGSDSAEPFEVTIAATAFKEILIRRHRESKNQLSRRGIRGPMHYLSVRNPG